MSSSSGPAAAPEQRLTAAQLHRLARECLGRAGMEADDAAIVASVLVKTSLRGIDTHGVALLPGYVRSLREGRVVARPQMRWITSGPCTAVLDAGSGPGVLAAFRAMETAIAMARQSGIALVAVRRSSHLGAASYYAAMALPHDMVGICGSNGPPIMAPFRGKAPALHNAPLAVAIPAGEEPPIVMDFAMSVVALRRIREAAERGQPIPEGWALDREGRPTTDPAAALGGSLLPLGHKGYALAIWVDVLAGVLSGAAFGGQVPVAGGETGHFVMAIHVGFFMPPLQFKARVDQLVRHLRATPPLDPGRPVAVPGERAARMQEERLRHGIPVSGPLLAQLRELAVECGVEPDF